MRILFTTILLLLCQLAIYSQDSWTSKEAFILYNGDPFLVELTPSGSIVKFIREAPEILLDFNSAERQQLIEYFDVDEDVAEIEDKKVISRKELDYICTFQPFDAKLTPTAIRLLKSIAQDYSEGAIDKIQIRSYTVEYGNIGRKLAHNRLEACVDLLVVYGVNKDDIFDQISPQKVQSPKVTFSFKKSFEE